MILDKGRGRNPETEQSTDTLESKLMLLADIKTELRKRNREYQESIKHLKESKKSLEAIITEEVKQMKQTVTVGNIRAEYVPQVVIRMKKEQNDGE